MYSYEHICMCIGIEGTLERIHEKTLDSRTCTYTQVPNVSTFMYLRWQSSSLPMQLIVFINIAETKLFTPLNSRYSLTNTGSW